MYLHLDLEQGCHGSIYLGILDLFETLLCQNE